MINELREHGINIVTKVFDDDIYMFNNGERELSENYTCNLNTDNNNEFKFIAISDTYFGSKYQQLSILNDICSKGINMGYNTIFPVVIYPQVYTLLQIFMLILTS